MAASKNTRLVAHIDCPGGGQVWVDGKTLYIGHMREPTGTTTMPAPEHGETPADNHGDLTI